MKISLTVIVAIFAFLLMGSFVEQSNSSKQNHANCLSKEDVVWYTNRSKSGIPRTCTNTILQHNLNKLSNQ